MQRSGASDRFPSHMLTHFKASLKKAINDQNQIQLVIIN